MVYLPLIRQIERGKGMSIASRFLSMDSPEAMLHENFNPRNITRHAFNVQRNWYGRVVVQFKDNSTLCISEVISKVNSLCIRELPHLVTRIEGERILLRVPQNLRNANHINGIGRLLDNTQFLFDTYEEIVAEVPTLFQNLCLTVLQFLGFDFIQHEREGIRNFKNQFRLIDMIYDGEDNRELLQKVTRLFEYGGEEMYQAQSTFLMNLNALRLESEEDPLNRNGFLEQLSADEIADPFIAQMKQAMVSMQIQHRMFDESRHSYALHLSDEYRALLENAQ